MKTTAVCGPRSGRATPSLREDRKRHCTTEPAGDPLIRRRIPSERPRPPLSTILGIVGAGGIGYQLADRLRVYEFGQASLMIILIIIAVAAIDALSGFLRRRLIGGAKR